MTPETPVAPPQAIPLYCTYCGVRHVDEGVWATRPHRRHLCAACHREFVVEPIVFGAPAGCSHSGAAPCLPSPRSPHDDAERLCVYPRCEVIMQLCPDCGAFPNTTHKSFCRARPVVARPPRLVERVRGSVACESKGPRACCGRWAPGPHSSVCLHRYAMPDAETIARVRRAQPTPRSALPSVAPEPAPLPAPACDVWAELMGEPARGRVHDALQRAQERVAKAKAALHAPRGEAVMPIQELRAALRDEPPPPPLPPLPPLGRAPSWRWGA